MIEYAEARRDVIPILEAVLSHGVNYSETNEWSHLTSLFEKTNEVKGIILYADHNYRWHSKTIFVDDDMKKEEEKLKFLSPLDMRYHNFYHRVGLTSSMYKKLYEIPKNLDGLDRVAVLAREYAENLSRSSHDRKIIFYCGPVNDTGGFFDLNLNLEHLFRAIVKGASKHEPVFDQTVFESHLVEITKQVKSNPAINQEIVLERFYKPLYHNWLVKEMRFLFNWESSGGARWERSIAIEKGIPQMILPKDYVDLSFAEKGKVAPQN